MEDLRGNSVYEEKARRHVAKLTLNVNFIVYFTYFQENVVVIVCTNTNYNSQPYVEDDLDSLDSELTCDRCKHSFQVRRVMRSRVE
jgi:hypothetical protein